SLRIARSPTTQRMAGSRHSRSASFTSSYGKPAEHRLPQKGDEQVTTVLAGAHIREHVTSYAGQARRVVQLAIGEQSRIGGDYAAAEFQLQAAVKIEPQRGARRLTRWVRHARLGRS